MPSWHKNRSFVVKVLEGIGVGIAVGMWDGLCVGCFVVGMTEGKNDGLEDGVVDGDLDGDGVGDRSHVFSPSLPVKKYPLWHSLQLVVECVMHVSSSVSPWAHTHWFATQACAPELPDKWK